MSETPTLAQRWQDVLAGMARLRASVADIAAGIADLKAAIGRATAEKPDEDDGEDTTGIALPKDEEATP